MSEKREKYRDSIKSILWGIILLIGAVLLWYHIVRNPLDELALIQQAKIANCILVDTYEDEREDYRGKVYLSDKGVYTFHLPDGRKFKTIAQVPSGLLKEQLEVEYLPDNPTVNRIKGDGCQSVGEWFWKKIGIGGLLLIILISPGAILISKSFKEIKAISHSNNKIQKIII